ncbi:CPBP family intramembrane metalloprotease [Nonomuraea sp. NN258]|uniref:CPBP family intramembrane glutamic endopeptidase n=1 Tax=Nonomuraea antri TaxID=2730852 RepID=UPI00156A1DFC|nr:CPBP family intramembrane glutamic endopeptidase [Nonomuraea antri]NRQ38883.1 CPBP family intramembrane metalloprotease [Nonomuraea antri]
MRSPLAVFLVAAFALSWAVTLPVWLGGGLSSPLTRVCATLMMFTPSAGVLAVWLLSRPRAPFREWAARTGLTFGERKGRTWLLILAAWLGTPLFVIGAMALSAALGLVKLDLDGLSLLDAALRAQGVPVPGGLGAVAAVQIAAAVVTGPVLNLVFALGEEWGWRGWLLPRLVSARGVLGGLVLSGAIWGVWHAPLTLLGYNYPRLGSWAAVYFIAFCVLAGIVFGWLRLRSGSVWPAVIGHGSLNAVAGPVLLLGDAAAPPDEVIAGPTGLVGLAVLALVAVVLLKFLPVRLTEPEPAA